MRKASNMTIHWLCAISSGCAQPAGTNGNASLICTTAVIADNFRDYCPNAFTLDALLKAKE